MFDKSSDRVAIDLLQMRGRLHGSAVRDEGRHQHRKCVQQAKGAVFLQAGTIDLVLLLAIIARGPSIPSRTRIRDESHETLSGCALD